MKLNRALIVLVIALAIALVVVVASTLQPRIVEAGDTAPDFKVVTDQGDTITRAQFGGKLLVLNFWATWCPPCIEEAPSLDQFQREYGPKGVVVVAVSIDRNEKLYRQFLARTSPSFQTFRDPSADISESYGTFQIPETYIIDRSGKVLEKVISNQNWMDPEFLKRVQQWLS